MKTKKEIKEWLLNNATNEAGDVDLSGIDFDDREVILEEIKAVCIYSGHQEAGERIHNYYQKAQNISNEGQQALGIGNEHQKAQEYISNDHQEAKYIIGNDYQEADKISNEEQQAVSISNDYQKAQDYISNELPFSEYYYTNQELRDELIECKQLLAKNGENTKEQVRKKLKEIIGEIDNSNQEQES